MTNPRRAGALLLLTTLLWSTCALAQTAPQIVVMTEHQDAAIYLGDRLICKGSCGVGNLVPGTQYTLICKKAGYDDGVIQAVFPAAGSITVQCPLNVATEDVTTSLPTDGSIPLPEVAEALSGALVHAVLHTNPGIQRCFDDAAGRGEVHAGKLWVQFWVTPDGTAGNARFEDAAYEGTEVATCAAAALDKLRFPPFLGAEGKSIRFPIMPAKLKAGADAGGTVIEFADAATGATRVPAVIDAYLGANAEITACFDDARARRKLALGEIWINFTVAPSGMASPATIVTDKYTGSDLETCVSGIISRTWFPSSSVPSNQVVMYRVVVE